MIAIGVAVLNPTSLLAIGGIGLFHMAYDTFLGPATSDAATWGSRGNTTLGVAISASEKYLQESSKVLKIVKPTGKVILVVGFAFDAAELYVGYSNADRLKNLITEVKKAHDDLIAKIKIASPTLKALYLKFVELRKQVEKRGKGWTAQTRETLEDEMRRSGYRPRI